MILSYVCNTWKAQYHDIHFKHADCIIQQREWEVTTPKYVHKLNQLPIFCPNYGIPLGVGTHCCRKYDVPSTYQTLCTQFPLCQDDVIKLKYFPRYWPFVQGIHRSPTNSPHRGQWRGALMFTLICDRINGWVNTGEAGDLRRHRTHYDVIVMWSFVVVR